MMKKLNDRFERLAKSPWDLCVSTAVGALLVVPPVFVALLLLKPHDVAGLATAAKKTAGLDTYVGLPYVGPPEFRPVIQPGDYPSEASNKPPPGKRQPRLRSEFSQTLYETGSILGLASALLISGIAIAATLLLSGWSQLTDALYSAYAYGLQQRVNDNALDEIRWGLREAKERVYVVRFFYRSGILATIMCTVLILWCTVHKCAEAADYRWSTGTLASACLISVVFLLIIVATTDLRGVPAKLKVYTTLADPDHGRGPAADLATQAK